MKEDSVFFDTTDLRILSILQNNAREPISQIARQVNLSGTAVLRRIHRMEDLGVILSYRTRVDPRKLGIGVNGYIIVKVHDTTRFHKYIQGIDEITSCDIILAGGMEFILQFHCRDNKHLLTLYDKLPKSIVESMTAYTVVRTIDKGVRIPAFFEEYAENNI